MTAVPIGMRGSADLATVFAAIMKNRCDAMHVHLALTRFGNWWELIDWGLKQRLVVSGSAPSFAEAGAVLALTHEIPDQMRRLAFYVDRILRGAAPSDLPIEQPTKFSFVINLKTAKALGLTIPSSLLARADQIIE
jgi:putative ABC transport system substrate-binding protein